MPEAIPFFALRLIAGIGLMLLLMPRQRVTSEFFRILMLVCLGLGVVAALTTANGPWVSVVLCGVAFLGSVLWLLERRRGGEICLALITAAGLWETFRTVFRVAELGGIVPGEMAVSTVAAIGTLGATLSGMLLGHRYLTAPGMPLAPLQRLNNAVGVAGLMRLVFSSAMLAMHGLPQLSGVALAWWLLRWVAGIVGPLAVWWLVRRILVYRNTQSATGVLFVGVILTFLGELSGDLLCWSTKIPY
jgi:hypothetical protein